MQRLRIGASCWAFVSWIGVDGLVVAIAVANAAIPCSVAAFARVSLAQAFGAPVLLGYKF
jgi:hypothetical protein